MASRRSELKRRFGITPEQYDEMLAEQEGVCAICGKEQGGRTLAVDHDHSTGEVRGLLCTTCNVHLAWLEDADWRSRAEAYLRR